MGVCQVVGFVTDEDFSGSLVANLYQIFPADSTMRGSIVGMIELFTLRSYRCVERLLCRE